jgi:hypothetical protein
MKFILIAFLAASPYVFADGVTDMENWSDQFIARYPQSESFGQLTGQTVDGKSCTLNVFKDLISPDWRSYYISFGTSTDGGTKETDYTYIGTWIHPQDLSGQCTVNVMEVTPQYVHLDVTQDEAGGPGGINLSGVQNDLLIRMDSAGNVTQVQGSSSYWPGSICIFK